MPGNEYFAGTHLNPNVTWWNQAGNFISYLNRCSYMLQQGLFAADVLYYYGDDVPNFVFLKEDVKLPFGYDWDKCSREALLKKLAVENGKAVFPDGMSYRLLVLPPDSAIDLDVLRKLELLVRQGLTVVGPRPVKATGLANHLQKDREVQRIAARLWGSVNGATQTENRVGQGKIVWGKDVSTVLHTMKVEPDFRFTSAQAATALDYIHRTGDGTDIYFVVNRFARKGISDFEYRYLPLFPPNRYEQIECSFRVAGMVPEWWDPLTGQITEIAVYREENGQTIIPLFFEPEESKFIVFRKAAASAHIVQIEKDGRPFFPGNQVKTDDKPLIDVRKEGKLSISLFEPGNYTLHSSDGKTSTYQLSLANKIETLSGAWELSFDTLWGGPAHVRFDSLQSWTQWSQEGIKYYSGKAVYRKNFSVDPASLKETAIMLDLGNVSEMASIKINGHEMPVRWCAPFRFDITNYVKAEDNQLEVEVVNLWPNRLIGDARLPAAKRLTKTNVIKYDAPGADSLLRPSGLLGPVQLRFIHTKIR